LSIDHHLITSYYTVSTYIDLLTLSSHHSLIQLVVLIDLLSIHSIDQIYYQTA